MGAFRAISFIFVALVAGAPVGASDWDSQEILRDLDRSREHRKQQWHRDEQRKRWREEDLDSAAPSSVPQAWEDLDFNNLVDVGGCLIPANASMAQLNFIIEICKRSNVWSQ